MRRSLSFKRPGWKALFFGLLGINIAVVLYMVYMFFLYPQSDPFSFNHRMKSPNAAQFSVSVSKDQLNRFLSDYLHKSEPSKRLQYGVVLDEDVKLYGSLTILGKKLNFRLSFDPVVQDNGDLVLQQKSIWLGELRLPVKTVLEVIRKNYSFPDWVTVNPKEQQIHIAITKMKPKDSMRFAAETFDLKRNLIAFKVFVLS